jgi:hypothetical protein
MRPRAAAAVLRHVGGAKSNHAAVALALLWAALAVLYLYNLDGSLMHDDEGTDLYEVWRLQLGECPGVDFMAIQQPLYLLAGSALVDIFGNNVLPLRLLGVVQLLGGAAAFAFAVARVFGQRTAVFALLLLLCSGMVYEIGRLFRPDPMMLGWELVGLGIALLAAKDERPLLWAASGLAYGMAFQWKPFAVFPLVGIGLFFFSGFLRRPYRLRFAADAFSFALPLGLIAGVGSFILHEHFDFYYLEGFRQQTSMGQGAGLAADLARPVAGYIELLVTNLVFLFLPALWLMNRRSIVSDGRVHLSLLLWQLVTPMVFVFITRRFYGRYLVYLIPVLAVFLGWQLQRMLDKFREPWSDRLGAAGFAVGILALGVAVTYPAPLHLLLDKEGDSLALAEYVAMHSGPEDVILSDYAGINFLADRKSIYEAATISGSHTAEGYVTTDLLLRRIEEDDVRMVLIHVEGGNPIPHQLVRLDDYERFRDYVQSHFTLLTEFDRNGQIIEVYSRN